MVNKKIAYLDQNRKLDVALVPDNLVKSANVPLGFPSNPVTDLAAPRPNLPVVYWAVDYTGQDPLNAGPNDIILPRLTSSAYVDPAAPLLSPISLVNSAPVAVWSAVTGATAYTLKRDGAAVYTGPNLTYTDVGAPAGVSHEYVVLAITSSGVSGPSAAQSVVIPALSNGVPDLVVTGISWSPLNPTEGDKVTFSATVKNQGTGATPTGIAVGVSFRVDNVPVTYSDQSTTSLAPGVSRTLTADGPVGSNTWTATAGNHTVLAWIDDVGRFTNESNSTNNKMTINLSIAPKPLIPTLTAVYSGNQVSASWPATTGATSYSLLRNGDEQYAGSALSYNDTAIVAGQTYTYVLRAINSAGAYAESDPVSVAVPQASGGLPDTVVTDITWTPTGTLAPGATVTFSAVVKNQGTGSTPAGTVIGVAFSVDGTVVTWSDTSNTSLAAGASRTLTANSGPSGSATWTATAGTHTVQAVVNDIGRYSESSSINNSFTKTITITGSSAGGVGTTVANIELPSTSATQANTAEGFLQSVGINAHANYVSGPYGVSNGAGSYKWVDKVKELGVRHIRDGIAKNQSYIVNIFNDLYTNNGIRVNVLVGRPWSGIFSSASYTGDYQTNAPAGTIDEIHAQLLPIAGAISSIESTNEADAQGYQNAPSSQGWPYYTKGYHSALVAKWRGNATTAGIPIIAPSLTGGLSNSQQIPNLAADFGNIHNYTSGRPETAAHMQSEFQVRAPIVPNKPYFSTECNPNTYIRTQDSNQPGVSERAQAIYTLRQYLEAWRSGVPRTFVYEIMDEGNALDAEQRWGLVRADFTVKPAFTALKNMISILNDPGVAFTPNSLNFTLSGATSLTRTVLLQKRDGSFWLAMWQEESSYNTSAETNPNTDRYPASVNITINVPTTRTFSLYTPTVSTGVQGAPSTGTSFTVSQNDVPNIIKIA